MHTKQAQSVNSVEFLPGWHHLHGPHGRLQDHDLVTFLLTCVVSAGIDMLSSMAVLRTLQCSK